MGKNLDVVTVICEECEGKGYYFIYNAYDLDYKEKCVCEQCSGSGVWFKRIGSGERALS